VDVPTTFAEEDQRACGAEFDVVGVRENGEGNRHGRSVSASPWPEQFGSAGNW
jgi:hypothetical protein